MVLPDCREILDCNGKQYNIYNITNFGSHDTADITRLPFSIRILLENLLRNKDGKIVKNKDIMNVASWGMSAAAQDNPIMVPYHPGRVLMQDFTGVPGIVDLAAMRDAVKDAGEDPEKINPLVPVDLVIDHSVQVDYYGKQNAAELNVGKEYERNTERYKFIKWAQKNFNNFRVVPPGSGICHQVNLEYFAEVIKTGKKDNMLFACPDTLVGTDSHTTMINGLGVFGWGVGGIEAEAVMLGQPYFMVLPEVVGVSLIRTLPKGVTATDLVLFITHALRKENVVEKFVEFTGPGLKDLFPADRATIANMSPEYGATMGFFPVDSRTIDYLKMTNRVETAQLVEKYCRQCSLFASGDEAIDFTKIVEIDLSSVKPCISGPSRPQDSIVLSEVKQKFNDKFPYKSHIHDNNNENTSSAKKIRGLVNGSIVIAAISSCTNTSNPHSMVEAGLVAKNAVKRGLKVPAFVKTSLSPGSKVVPNYFEDSGLMKYLNALGFNVTGFGCMTCIGNSGPLNPDIEKNIRDNNLVVAAAVSSNRNFEARVHQSVRANYLMSPAFVIMYALAGRINIDFNSEPLGYDESTKEPVFMKDIWPDHMETDKIVTKHVKPQLFAYHYSNIFKGDELWRNLQAEKSKTFPWNDKSTYIRKPSFFKNFSVDASEVYDFQEARVLLFLGDSVTTDHISPAGAIPADYPAGKYLIENGVDPSDFNSYGSRRGNHEVMMRGTFGNIRIKNRLVKEQGSFTLKFPEKIITSVFDASVAYQRNSIPLIVLGGKEYGTGSSRDWAAKGPSLQGVKVVVATSYERIHRSNLLGMGILPLEFVKNDSIDSLGISGNESFSIKGLNKIEPAGMLDVEMINQNGSLTTFSVKVRIDTKLELEYWKAGGILNYVLLDFMK